MNWSDQRQHEALWTSPAAREAQRNPELQQIREKLLREAVRLRAENEFLRGLRPKAIGAGAGA
jgi:hypothetical protein